MAASTNGFKVIGTRPIRHDGVDKVTGRAKYGADYAFPGMLHGKVLRSPHANAIIKSIKTDKALALPGVKAVITAADWPLLPDKVEQGGEGPVNLAHLSLNLLARDKVLVAIKNALEHSSLRRENQQLREMVGPGPRMIGASSAFLRVV